MAQHHDDAPLIIGQRQAQPELENMRLTPRRHGHNALRGTASLYNFAIGRIPIKPLIAEIELIEATAGRFNAEIIAQPRSRQPNPQPHRLTGPVSIENIEKADTGQQRLDLSRANIGTRGMAIFTALRPPVVEKLLLLRNNELCADGLFGGGQNGSIPLACERPPPPRITLTMMNPAARLGKMSHTDTAHASGKPWHRYLALARRTVRRRPF